LYEVLFCVTLKLLTIVDVLYFLFFVQMAKCILVQEEFTKFSDRGQNIDAFAMAEDTFSAKKTLALDRKHIGIHFRILVFSLRIANNCDSVNKRKVYAIAMNYAKILNI